MSLNTFQNFHAQSSWAVNIAHSRNFDEFITRLARMPDDIPPLVFDKWWRNYILKTASKSIGPYFNMSTMKAFNKMYDDYNKLFRKDFMTSADIKMGSHIKKKFVNYLYDSLSGVGVCGHLFKKKGAFNRPFLF